MNSIKIERLNHLFLREISNILQTEVKNNLLKSAIITDVDITSDLSYAKVYFRLLDDTNKKETIQAFNKASSFIRHNLSERIDIRHTPELNFIYDESIEYGENIENIIENIHKEKGKDD